MLKKLLAVFVMLYTALAMAAVDVNKASEAELDGVKGIGPVTSKLILAERKNGPFKNWEDFISRVKGVGENRAAKLSDVGLTVNGSAFKGAAAARADKKDARTHAPETRPVAIAPRHLATSAKPGAAPEGAVAPGKPASSEARK